MTFRYCCEKPLQILSEADLEEIHQASLQVLDEVGIVFADEGTCRFLRDHGCTVDAKNRVKFPPGLVEGAL